MLEKYHRHSNGLIEQIKRQRFEYGVSYSEKYNEYGEKGKRMSHLRLGHLIGALGFVPRSIIDIGYGNGDFLEACTSLIPHCYGFDVSDYPPPQGAKRVKDPFSVETTVAVMYDSLEHFDDIYTIRNLKSDYLVVTVPNCHYPSDAWFEAWKHRKPDEHIWHFSSESLSNFLSEIGYQVLQITNVEDAIRKSNESQPNTITAVCKLSREK